MPRTYIRAIGKKPYANYSQEQLNKALLAVHYGATVRQAAEKYGVARSTLARHKNNKNTGKYGRPPVFSEENEAVIVQCICAAGDWGFPFSKYDIRCIIKSHLDRKGLVEKRFKNNLPGRDWINSFLMRHKNDLATRLAQNIKRSRAAVDEDTINLYFDELDRTLKDVEPALIINYDETNITDDPKRQRVIVRRGCRHPEKIIDNSKSSTSVMFSAAGDGHLLPPYINYKAEHLYSTWTQGGPTGTVYNRTKSGWFTMNIFEDWFKTIVLPYIKKFDKDKTKVLIGDNLASHVSTWVIQKCVEYNIRFVLMPPNSTGLCQPLDVAYFKPLKSKWSNVLTEWKLKNRGVIPKDTFPRLLKNCLQGLSEKTLENLKAGFKASGLIPLNRDEVLKRLPKARGTAAADTNPQDWVDSFKEFLMETRTKETQVTRVKKRKFNLKPGASITNEDLLEDHNKENIRQEKSNKKKQKKNISSRQKDDCPSETDTDATISIHDSDEEINFIEIDETDGDDWEHDNEDISILETSNIINNNPLLLEPSTLYEPSTSHEPSLHNDMEEENCDEKMSVFKEIETSLSNESFVVVKFLYNEGTKKQTEKHFMAQVIDSSENHVFVKVMRKSTKVEDTYIFPIVEDEQIICPSLVVKKVIPISISRGRYLFPKSTRQYKCN